MTRPAPPSNAARDPAEISLCQELLRTGRITSEQLQGLLARTPRGRLGDALVSCGAITPTDLDQLRRGSHRAPSPSPSQASSAPRPASLPSDPASDTRHGGPPGMPPPGMPGGPQRRLGRYLLVNELGRGGMGIVHRAWDPSLARFVAIKELAGGAESGTQAQRFEREGRTSAQLRHPNIVAVHEVARDDRGRPFLVMDLIEGESLEARLRRDRPTPREVAEIVRQAALACDHAHARGVVHRDVKPENILIDGDSKVAYLTDFGLAREVTAERITVSGQLLGTPVYMSPEQISREHGEVGAASDIYGLGGVLYRALAGEPPFDGGELMPLLRQVVMDEPPRVARPGVEVHPDLETIALRCLEKLPSRRYPTAAELAADIGRFLDGEPIHARPANRRERARRWVRRHRLATAGLLGSAVVIVGAAIAGSIFYAAAQRRIAGERAALVADARRAADEAWSAMGRERARARDARDRRALERLLAHGLAAVQTSATLRALAPDDRAARERALEATVAYGEAALAAEQWTLAASAFEGTSALGIDDGRARALLARVTNERERATAERRDEVEQIIETARAGQLGSTAGGYDDALFALAREPDPLVVGLLVNALDGVSDELRAVTRSVLGGAGQPTPDEARAGETEIVGLAEALERTLTLPPGELVRPEDGAVIARAAKRLERRELRRRPENVAGSPLDAMTLVGGIQRERVGEGPLLLGRLCSEALGRIGIGEEAIEALGRRVFAEADDLRALPAAVALCRIGGERAIEIVLAARDFFGPNGAFSRQIAPFLARTGRATQATSEAEATAPSASASPTTVGALIERAERRAATGDHPGALADLDRAIALDANESAAFTARAIVRKESGDRAGALEDFARTTELTPARASAWGNLGSLRAEGGDFARALEALNRAVDLDPSYAGAIANRGSVRIQLGDVDGAIVDLRRATELDGRLANAWNSLGGALARRGDLPGAIAAMDRAIELSPEFVIPRLNRAGMLRASGDLAGSITALDRIITDEPRLAHAWAQRGLSHQARGDHRTAIADFDCALELDANLSEALSARTISLRAIGEDAQAESDAERATEAGPDSAQAWNARGLARFARGDFRGAVEDFDRAVQKAPTLAEAWNNRGNARREMRDLAGAIADLEKALELDPSLPQAWANLGFARQQSRQLPTALQAYDRAIDLAPDLAMTWSYRASAKMAMGNSRGAIADYDRALELDPNLTTAYTNRGMLRAGTGDQAGGIADLDRAIELDPRQAKAFGNRGNVRRLMGDLDGAVADLTRALELAPNDPHPFGVLGIVRSMQGDRAGAIADFERYLQMAPGSPNAPEVRARLAKLRGGG